MSRTDVEVRGPYPSPVPGVCGRCGNTGVVHGPGQNGNWTGEHCDCDEPIGPPPETRWWLCPNSPPCPHGAALHDVEDYEDTSPRCCVEVCTCGRKNAVDETTKPSDG